MQARWHLRAVLLLATAAGCNDRDPVAEAWDQKMSAASRLQVAAREYDAYAQAHPKPTSKDAQVLRSLRDEVIKAQAALDQADDQLRTLQ
jgi:hypothetical protein